MGASGGPHINGATGLVGVWDPADLNSYPGSGTVATDLSGNGNNGTLNAAAVGTTASNVWSLDGTDYITVSDSSDFTFGTEPFALEAWIYFTDFSPGGDDWTCALQQYQAANQRNGLFLFYNGASPDIEWRLECNWGGFSSGKGFYATLLDMDSYVSLNEWHLYTISRQQEALFKRYVDGVLRDTDTTADGETDARSVATYETDWPNITGDIQIGDYTTSDHHEIQGEMGPVRIYKGRALSDAEVLQNYNAQRGRFGV